MTITLTAMMFMCLQGHSIESVYSSQVILNAEQLPATMQYGVLSVFSTELNPTIPPRFLTFVRLQQKNLVHSTVWCTTHYKGNQKIKPP